MSSPLPPDIAPSYTGHAEYPLTAWFLGPRAENATVWTELFEHIFTDYVHWRRNYFPTDPWIVGRARRRSAEHESWYDLLTTNLDAILSELKYHFPLHSPRYIAHMVSEQSLPAVLGHFAGLLYNPNNVTGESAPITVALELEVGRMIATMLGYQPRKAWAHICSGGTLATIEALWVARSVQFAPFIARDFCREHTIPFRIRTPGGVERPLAELEDATVVALRPQETVTLFRSLARQLQGRTGEPAEVVLARLNDYAGAHYSVAKACNLLGYGEDALRLVPVNSRFQMDVGALETAMAALAPQEYVAAVIGIVGTTEEGAVDPIHRITALRERRELEQNRSFWLHIDAAWGGYLRALFNGLPAHHLPVGASIEAAAEEYARVLQVRERFEVDLGLDQPDVRTIEVQWEDRETYAAFLAMAEGDSTTIDPHKMGYVPYPAGVVAFKNGLVTEFITQRAQYLSDEEEGIGSSDAPVGVTAFGPHILEGSKPGAAALSCWLAHRTIPLTHEGHGKIVRTSLLSARRLGRLLEIHAQLFPRLERERVPNAPASAPFTFLTITEPETNIVCYVARPMRWEGGVMLPAETPLPDINGLNQRVYAAASIPGSRSHQLSAAQPFFISRTRFEEEQYHSESLRPLLARLGVSEEAYRKEGLFVLRSTVMNPWHGEAEKVGMDYLYEFLRFLHRVTAEALYRSPA
jgi:glutamate/tyrosine decarboxylase-like PLP-dependent enzyme